MSSNQHRGNRRFQWVLCCFRNVDISTEPTAQEIIEVRIMPVFQLVNNPRGKRWLIEFLERDDPNDRSKTRIWLECHELCKTIIRNIERYGDHIDELIKLCPDMRWKVKLNDAIESAESDLIDRLQSVLDEFQTECYHGIRCSRGYSRFLCDLHSGL